MTIWALVLLSATGCARAAPAASPVVSTPTVPVSTIAVDPALEGGRNLFLSKGCANCHGVNLEFLIVVNLREISPAAIIEQVRSPTGMMQAFSPEELSDDDLEAIAEFVAAVLTQRERLLP